MTKVFIGVCYHKESPIIKNNVFHPIHVGEALSNVFLPDAIPDSTGQNISHKNKAWCELTAIYWMRHNVEADYIGLAHYRRILDFSGKPKRERVFEEVSPSTFRKFGWDEENVINTISGYDIVMGERYGVHIYGVGGSLMTNFDFYRHQHFENDMDVVENIIKENHPEYYPHFLNIMNSRRCSFGNIVVMRKEIFHEYSDWMFDVLELVEKKIDISNYDSYQSRIFGFIAERLTNVFIDYSISVHKRKVLELPVVYGIIPRPKIDPAVLLENARKKIASSGGLKKAQTSAPSDVIMAFDDNYVSHAAATINSVLSSANSAEGLRFHILCNKGLSAGNRDKLSEMVSSKGAKIEFYEIRSEALAWLPLNRSYISEATYYRLLINEVIPSYVTKAVYLDSDTICVEPIENLLAVDMEGYAIGGCPDEGGVNQSRRLRLPVDKKYINAGVLLLNIDYLRKFDIKELTYSAFRKYGDSITLQDQDIINISFIDGIKILPLKWNVGVRATMRNELDPGYTVDQALEAIWDPAIIHFTDRIKPWSNRSMSPFTELYWDSLSKTPWAITSGQDVKRKIQKAVREKLLKKHRLFMREVRKVSQNN